MAFPTDPQLRESVFIPLDTPDLYVADYGEAKTYTTFTNEPGQFIVRMRLTAARLQAWEDHRDANGLTSDTFTWQLDSQNYSCFWEDGPQSQRLAPDLFDVTVTLRVAS